MRTLVIDSATQALSVALFDDETLRARHHVVVGRGHAEHLLPAIAALPDQGRADRIAVDVGPGSFTGVRIGLAAARALAFAWSVPLAGYGAPALIAVAARERHEGNGPVAIAITGGHGELFWQLFAPETLDPASPVTSTPIPQLARMLDMENVYGTGAEALVAARGWGTAVPLHPDSGDFARLPAHLAALPPIPVYGRGADARPMAG